MDSFIAQWMMFTYELPFESTAYFTELVSITEVPKSFKVVPFERTDQRRVFRVAVMVGINSHNPVGWRKRGEGFHAEAGEPSNRISGSCQGQG